MENILQSQVGTRFSRGYYSASIETFLGTSAEAVLGTLTASSEFSVDLTQRDAWQAEIALLRNVLQRLSGRGRIYLEFVVPRLGKRIDAVLLVDGMILIIEFKIGAKEFARQDVEQAWDYALDLKNFHETSHGARLVPILVITGETGKFQSLGYRGERDGILPPILVSGDRFEEAITSIVGIAVCESFDGDGWESGRYLPTPTIVEAASALYRGHAVTDIARHDAGARNLTVTTASVAEIIESSRRDGVKAICLVTGVPGAGKTLVGLDIATRYMDPTNAQHSVYLSGNGPLVAILREALARDDVKRSKANGKRRTKGEARQAVKAFIQPIHHFRDECLKDSRPPPEHVAIFDEAQRAWNLEKTADFMRRKRSLPNFDQSEPAFLISCLDRQIDWAVVVCLIGGGQEINTGEAGISGWIRAIQNLYPSWHLHLSPHLQDVEYNAGAVLSELRARPNVFYNEDLHLSVSMRSFRAEHLSGFVKKVLDLELDEARDLYKRISGRYQVVLTRDVGSARQWLRDRARGSERFGICVSSQALRLKPLAIDIRSPVDPVNWFLNDRDDVRSSFYLEDVATEFHVQGLELDWSCVVWDADFRHSPQGWQHHSFVGDRWQQIRKEERKVYLKNAYRVLLTRARQGMIIVVPEGAQDDETRRAEFYDGTYRYLRDTGLPTI